MTTTHENHEGHDEPAAVPPIVGRETWLAARDELLVREKAHMRAGDAIAAARRRLPMTEVDASTTVVGPDGPRTLLDLFEGREELVVYRHMWFPGEPFENQCEGCTMTYWATQNLSAYLNARGVSFAVFAEGLYAELARFVEFMGYPRHWYSTVDVEDDLVRGDGYGAWTCWLRQGDRVFLTTTVTGRGLEVSMPALALLDMTARGRLEAWQDYPEGWPEGKQPGWFWRSHEDGVGNKWTGGRPTVQWTRALGGLWHAPRSRELLRPERHLGAMPHVDVPAYSGTLAAQLTRPYPWFRRTRVRQRTRSRRPSTATPTRCYGMRRAHRKTELGVARPLIRWPRQEQRRGVA